MALLLPRVAAAQDPPPSEPRAARDSRDGSGQAALLSAKALLNGLTVGITQELRGSSFQDGFTRTTWSAWR